jgi:choline dehydrogenase-like flavoprotein
MANNEFDAIVIGSGISGGVAAKELTEKGLKTILLERGMDIRHVKDYTEANKEAWDYPHRGARTQQMIKDYPVLGRKYPLNERNLSWWASDKDSPYTEVKRFDWFRGYQVGGRSLLWGRQTYRWSDMYFEENAKQGIAIDWPVRYKDIEPWYDHVERYAGISGSKEGLPELPDSQFLPPMEMNCVEKDLAQRIKKLFDGNRKIIIGRCAHATVPMDGRQCLFRNKCWYGCLFGGYFSTQSVTLPAAMKTGNLTLRPWSIVTQILFDKDTQRATGVEVLDAETMKTYVYKAKIIFLNASTLNSAWILMNSATDIWPGGLGSSSGELGHNVMDHHQGLRASGRVEGYLDKYVYGRRANGIYIPRFRNFFGDKRNYLRGFGYQGGASRQRGDTDGETSIGTGLKESMSRPGAWTFSLDAFGEILPYHENKVTLDKTRKDKWGLNVLAMDCELKENEWKMRKDMLNDAKEILDALGVKDIEAVDDNDSPYPGRSIHEMGTARMGEDSRTSVLNKWNQVWDAPNVFVTDGSFMTSSACQNPSLTYMAFTARAVDFAVRELRRRNL